MKFSYNWLKELLPSIVPPKETAELLARHAFEAEEPKRESGDWVIDVDVLPNRMADASSHVGIARELAAILAVRKKTKPAKVEIPAHAFRENLSKKIRESVEVTIRDKKACSLYAVRAVAGVRVAPSPKWLVQRLRAVGVEPINNIVDATNYVLLETGQPLHAFDLEKLEGRGSRKSVVIRRAKKGEKIRTLDGTDRRLDPSVLVIADTKKPLAIAGIKGGAAAAVGDKTITILIESALFDAASIYQSSRRLGVATDASKRFEVGRSPQDVLSALDRVVGLILTVAGGRALEGRIVVGRTKASSRSIALSPSRVSEVLGMTIPEPDMKRALEAIGAAVRTRRDAWTAEVPTNRFDLEREEDLIEEIGRLWGYENLTPGPVHGTFVPLTASPLSEWGECARDALAAQGFSETVRHSFVGESLLGDWGVGPAKRIRLENPQSSEATALRSTLLPRLFLQAKESLRFDRRVALFEVGNLFERAGAKIRERSSLAVVFMERGEKGSVAVPFLLLKGAAQELCERFGISGVVWQPLSDASSPWHSGRTAALLLEGKRIGIVGELRPSILRKHEIDRAAAAEIDLEALSVFASEEHAYQPPSRYPEVVRDLSVLVPTDVLVDYVQQEIERAGKLLIRDTDLFDYYEGSEVPEGMKSLAFRIVYQASDRTLTSEEVDALHQKIEEALRARNWEVR